MTTSYSPLWRIAELTPLDPGTVNTWGTILTDSVPLFEEGAVGITAVSINGLTSYTLSTANNASDQARYLVQQYTGALTGNCTVTVPNQPKIGYAQNSTTGGFSVIISAGAGTTITIPPNGNWYFYATDGATNVEFVPFAAPGWQEVATYTASTSASVAVMLPTGYKRYRATFQAISFSANGAVLLSQFSSNGGSSYFNSNYAWIQFEFNGGNTSSVFSNGSDSSIPLTANTNSPTSLAVDGTLELYPGSASFFPSLRTNSFGFTSAGLFEQIQYSGTYQGVGLINAFLLSPSIGTFSGTIILEGLP